jgi:hypothetical protein
MDGWMDGFEGSVYLPKFLLRRLVYKSNYNFSKVTSFTVYFNRMWFSLRKLLEVYFQVNLHENTFYSIYHQA